jgi:hypothetical protein
VRKWALLAIVLAACSRNPSMGSSMTGAPSARDAANLFIGAAKAQDLQAMGSLWGTAQGASRDHMDRQQLDQRLVILQPCYVADRVQIVDESMGSTPTERRVRLQLTRGSRTKNIEFKVVRGPSNRWYVEDTDYDQLQADFCRPG